MATRQFIVELLNAQGDVVQKIPVDRVTLVSSRVTGSTPSTAASFTKRDGDNQSSTVSTAVTALPSVLVVDANGLPVSGVSVSFIQSANSGVVTGAQQTTNVAGIATVGSWSLGTIAGTQRLEVKAGSLSTQTFTATAVAGSAFSVTPSGGTSQTTHVGGTLPSRLTVLVHDSWSNAVTSASVTLTSTDAEGVFGASAITTNSSGVAGTTYQVGTQVAASVATIFAAISSATSALFAATSTVSIAALIAIVAGDGQIGEVSTNLPINPQVLVTDTFGNPVSGSIVTWEAGAGSLSTDRTATGSAGTAATVWTLGASAGTQLLTARGDFTSDSTATFTISATTPAATNLALSGGNNQSAAVATDLASRLTVRATTASGTSAVGVNVSWIASQGTLGANAVVTDSDGYAGVTYSAGTTAGTSLVTASASGLTGSPVAFTVSVTTGTRSDLTFVAQPSSNVGDGVVFAQQPSVQFLDRFGNANPANGVVMTIAKASGGASLTGTLTATSNSAGRATWTNLAASGAGQSLTLQVSSSGVTAQTSNTVNVAPPVGSQLAFTVQPTTTNSGSPFSPTLVVAVQDSLGNTVPGATDLITIAISAGGTLTGTVSRQAAVGLATFTGLAPTTQGTGFSLTATSGTLTPAVSSTFNVTAAASHPNEPAGMTVSINADCVTATGTPNTAGGWNASGNNLGRITRILPADVPAGHGITTIPFTSLSGFILRGTCPGEDQGTGQSPGTGPFTITANFGPWTEVYVDEWFMLDPLMDADNGAGGTGQSKAFGWIEIATGNQHYIKVVQTAAGSTSIRFTLQGCMKDPNGVTDMSTTGGCDFTIATGLQRSKWYRIIRYMKLNTGATTFDGIGQVWFGDENGVTERLNKVQLGYAGNNTNGNGNNFGSRFNRYKWNPTWVSGGVPNPFLFYHWMANPYLSGKVA